MDSDCVCPKDKELYQFSLKEQDLLLIQVHK